MTELTAIGLGARIREARERRGLLQAELGERLGLDRTVVNKIESGTRRVSALELAQIAEALRVQMMSFFSGPLPAVVSHRSSQGLEVIESKIDELLDGLAADVELAQELGGLPKRESEAAPLAVPTTHATAETMAGAARSFVGLDKKSPARDLQRLLGDSGLLLFSRNLGSDTADAGTVLLRDGSGVSLVNSAQKVGRRRLAAAHEFGHFLIADDYSIDWDVTAGGRQTESLLDYFARAFLLPEVGLRELWESKLGEGLRPAAVIAANAFRVDMATLSRRLTDLELIDATDAGNIRDFRTTSADMIDYDLHAHDELAGTSQPRRYQQAVLRLVRNELLSVDRALELLWHTLEEPDLPLPHVSLETEIWGFVS